MKAHFAAVDWGTSSFRIWLMSQSGQVLAERRSHEGMVHTAASGFADILQAHLHAFGAPPSLPVVICGMAGARQGWLEADYLNVPAKLLDIVDRAVRIDDPQRDIRILPGIAQRNPERPDVMRGEETQLLGGLASHSQSALFCLPGTHSKWVEVQSGSVTGFATCMTGELFSLIRQQSILQHAMGDIDSCDPGNVDFLAGVRDAYDRPSEFSRLLFSIRAGQLLFASAPERNYARLSGLLIGFEIAGCLSDLGETNTIHLIASGRLRDLYEAAFSCLALQFATTDADKAVLAGLFSAAQKFWPQAILPNNDGSIKT